MTMVAGAFSTHVAVGNREDLTDAIYNISPTDTPFLSKLPRVKAKARTHEWQTDSLTAAAENAHLEGDVSSATTATPTVRVKNHTQIFKKTIAVSGTQEVVDKAGRDSEIAYQLMKVGKEIKRDMEYALTQNRASSVGDSGSLRKLGSTISFIGANGSNWTTKASGSATLTTGGYNASTGNTIAWIVPTSNGTLTENDLKAVISACWTAGGQPDVLLVDINAKKKISGFLGIADITKEAGNQARNTRIIGGADIYVSDVGEHRVVPSRFNDAEFVQVLDMDQWALAQLRGMTKERLAKTGDAETYHLLTEVTLESRQQLASGLIVGIDGAL
jgi:hypothetical protein